MKYFFSIITLAGTFLCLGQSTNEWEDKEAVREKMLEGLKEFFVANNTQDDFGDLFHKKIDSLVTIFPNDPVVVTDVFADLIMDPLFTYDQVISTFNKIDTASIDASDLLAMKNSINKMRIFQPGVQFEDFSAVDSTGATQSVKDFRGKYLLIEFWASWCGPCKEVHPDLNEIYGKYQAKGFEVFGVSIDENETAWKKAIVRDDLRWINTIIPGGFKSDMSQKLHIQYTPSNFLIDKEGKLITYNVRPHQLNTILEGLEID